MTISIRIQQQISLSLLHDIALIKKIGYRKDHHINGAKIAKEMLETYNCPQKEKERVIGCVLNHRSSKNATNIEELCVCDADILAHFDNIPMIFNSGYNRCGLNLNEIREWIKKDFETITPKGRTPEPIEVRVLKIKNNVFVTQNANYEANILSHYTEECKGIAKTPIIDTIKLVKSAMTQLKIIKEKAK